MSDDVLKHIRDAYAEFASMPPPRTDPIKLTQEQFDSLKAMLLQQPRPAWFTDTAMGAMHGVPVVVVDSTVESTPYLEGWIKCPSCGKPAAGHDELPCDLVLIFGPFGDIAVSGAPAAGLRRLRHQVKVAAARKQAAHAIARWEDDGGSCR